MFVDMFIEMFVLKVALTFSKWWESRTSSFFSWESGYYTAA